MKTFLGYKINSNEFRALIIVLVIAVIVSIALLAHTSSGGDDFMQFKQSIYAPPDWLFMIMTIVIVAILTFGAYTILTRMIGDEKILSLTIWIVSVFLLWSAYLALFKHAQLGASSGLLMMFLAFHVALLFKFQFISSYATAFYAVGALVMIYFLLVLIDTKKV